MSYYKHTGLDDHAGRHSSKEILRIGMFRTPFRCEYYQYTENIHLARTKIIFSCLLLLEALGLEFYYRPLEPSTMVTHSYNMTYYSTNCNTIQIWSWCSRYLSSVGNRYPAIYVASYVERKSEVKKCPQQDLKMLRVLLSICWIIKELSCSISRNIVVIVKYLLAKCSGKGGNIAGCTNNSFFAQHRKHCCDIVCWIMNS